MLRTVDVARRSGYSVQQIRNLERDGVLPPVARTTSGYRVYRRVHLESALAYRALAAGTGPTGAKRIIATMLAGHEAQALALLDTAHADLAAERTLIAAARHAVAAIAGEPLGDIQPEDALSIGDLAAALGVRTSTLRHWDAEHLVTPDRRAGNRWYSPAQVRDARIVQQLRAAGYRIPAIRDLLPTLRTTDIDAALDARDAGLTARSRALLDAAAALVGVLSKIRENSLSSDVDSVEPVRRGDERRTTAPSTDPEEGTS